MRSFRRDEADIFFGRSKVISKIIQRLETQRFVTITGPSGCGKSSLISAGLLPALDSLGTDTELDVVAMRPGDAPLRNLAQAISTREPAKSSGSLAEIEAVLRSGPRGLIELVRGFAPSGFVLLVDQFEEIFRFLFSGSQDDFRRAEMGHARHDGHVFVDTLLTAAQSIDVPVKIVMSLRADFIGDSAEFHGLPEALNEGQFLVPRLTRHELMEAIEGPVRVFNAQVDAELVNQCLNEMEAGPDQLALMQHAMHRVWTSARARMDGTKTGVRLTIEDYKYAGGIGHSIANHAEETLNHMCSDSQRIAEAMFLSLCEISESGSVTRRPCRIAEIAKVAGCSTQECSDVAKAFVTENLLVSVGSFEHDDFLDLTHGAILRYWLRLREWAQSERKSCDGIRRISEAACRWRDSGRQAGLLWQGPELHLAQEWIEEVNPTPAWAARYTSEFELCKEFLSAAQIGTSIFISYRREDSTYVSQMLFKRLSSHFGKNRVFYDVDSIPEGVEFPRFIDEKLTECAVVVAVIGSRWLNAGIEDGRRRLEDPNDFVRIEIESALRSRTQVVPLLIENVDMPNPKLLPSSIQKLVELNAAKIPTEGDFDEHVNRLVRRLEEILGHTQSVDG